MESCFGVRWQQQQQNIQLTAKPKQIIQFLVSVCAHTDLTAADAAAYQPVFSSFSTVVYFGVGTFLISSSPSSSSSFWMAVSDSVVVAAAAAARVLDLQLAVMSTAAARLWREKALKREVWWWWLCLPERL